MGLADDVLDDIIGEEEEVYEEQPETLQPQKEQQSQRVEEKNEKIIEKEEQQEHETKNEQKLDLKKLIILILGVVISYVVVIQYKLLDTFLESKLENIPIFIKRFSLFSIIISVLYGIVSFIL